MYRFHVMPRCQLFVPQASFFTIPLKYNDVTRQTESDSDSAAEHTIDDCWNIDGATTLSDDWVVRSRFHFLRPRALFYGRQTKVQNSARLDSVWPGVCLKLFEETTASQY